jgi:DNA-binding HxlR family transcriptional regulator
MRSSGYGQFCPVAKAAEILTERWTPLVLRELLAGSHRFNELRRGVPLMSPTLLSDRLHRLERSGVVRRVRTAGERHWEYHLTEAGEAFRPVIELMGAWGRKWALGRISSDDLDPAFMMWAMLRRIQVRGDLPPSERVVTLFDFSDAGQAKRYWWLILQQPEVELCLSDPGFAVDLHLRSDLRTMARILLGEVAIDGALRSRAITLEGPVRLRQSLPRWLGFGALAAGGGSSS